MNLETYTVNSSVTALKGVSKAAGVITVLSTAYDVYEDFNTYEGNDRYYAAALTIGGTATGIIATSAIATVSAPVWVTVVAGTAVCVIIGIGIDKLKDVLFTENKK